MKNFKLSLLLMTAILFTGADVTYTDAGIELDLIQTSEARRGGFRSGGSRGFRNYSKPKPRPSRPASKPKPKPKAKPLPPSSTKASAKKPAASSTSKPKPKTRFASTSQRRSAESNAKQAFSANQQKYSRPAQTSKANYSSYKSSPVVGKSSKYDSRTYHVRREARYSDWNRPSYVYMGAPSYGMWDSNFLWNMVLFDAMFGHHHSRDPGYQAWRSEADQLAKENDELRVQLATLDQQINGIPSSTKADPSYVPAGIDADLALTAELVESLKPTLRLCTGQTDGTYAPVGTLYGKLVESADINVVNTTGSSQNLDKLNSNECDAALVQRDAYWVYLEENPSKELPMERIASPFNEYVHLVCNSNDDVYDINDVSSNNSLLLGDNGSGSAVTWRNLSTDTSLDQVSKTFNSAVETRSQITSNDSACMLYVGALGSPRITLLDSVSNENLRLVDIDDSDYFKHEDPAGNKIYSAVEIKKGTYSNLQRGWNDSGWFSYTDTISVPVDVVVSNNWIKSNGSTYHRVVEDVSGLNGAVQQLIETRLDK